MKYNWVILFYTLIRTFRLSFVSSQFYFPVFVFCNKKSNNKNTLTKIFLKRIEKKIDLKKCRMNRKKLEKKFAKKKTVEQIFSKNFY